MNYEEILNQLAGNLSAQDFTKKHPMEARKWLWEALKKLNLIDFIGLFNLVEDLSDLSRKTNQGQ